MSKMQTQQKIISILLFSAIPALINGFIFEGCYSDADGMILQGTNTVLKYFSDNINSDCAEYCRESGYAIASTRGSNCYCTNSLPTPQLFSARSTNAGGAGGSCVTPCPGTTLARQQLVRDCVGDECCGGPQAYSVYLVGSIDALKQLERRIVTSVLTDEDFRNTHFPNIERLPLFSLARGISSDGRITSSSGGYAEGSSKQGSPNVHVARDVFSRGLPATQYFYLMEIEFNELCTLYDVSQKITTASSHQADVYFSYRNVNDITIRFDQRSNVQIEGARPINSVNPNGIKVKKVIVGYLLGPQKVIHWEVSGTGNCGLNIEVTASGKTANKDGIGELKTYQLFYSNNTKTETLNSIGPKEDLNQLNMEVIRMDKVLDFDETLEENPLGSKFQCRFTYTGDNQDCERRYAVTSSFTESFNTQVGLGLILFL